MIKITRHKEPVKVCEIGDIRQPFRNWESTSTGAKFFSRPDKSFYGKRKFLPLVAISQRTWSAAEILGIKVDKFKKSLEYECPYTEYTHYWAIPIYLFSERVDEIVDNTEEIYWKDYFKDHKWQAKEHFPKHEKGEHEFACNSIAKSFLGAGYTYGILPSDGHGRIHDAITALDNGDFLGMKVWVWYNK